MLVALAVTLVAGGCTGERPELIQTGQGAPPVSEATTTSTATTVPTATVPELQEADCTTAVGAGPWRVVIEAAATPTVRCVLVANHQRLEFVNDSTDPVAFELAGLSVSIEPASSFVSEPAGTFLQPGLTVLDALPHPVSGIWLTDPSSNTLSGLPVGLSSLGSISIGTPVDQLGQAVGAALSPGEGACYQTAIAGDPHSPVFTIVDGSVAAIEVFTPGQLTRSEIGVGSAEGDVLAVYGQQIESVPSADDPTRALLVFVPNDEADGIYRLAFVVDDGVVTSMRNGLTDTVLAGTGCPG